QARRTAECVSVPDALVGGKEEHLILLDWPTDGRAEAIVVQFRHLVLIRYHSARIAEKRSGVQYAILKMIVEFPMDSVRAGLRDYRDLRAALATLRRIVHSRIDAHLLQCFRRRRGHSLADLVVDGGIRLALGPVSGERSGVGGKPCGIHLARALAI